MSDRSEDKDLEEAKRIMERLVKTPPQPHDKADKAKSKEAGTKKEKPDD